MTNKYDAPDEIRITATFTDAAGTVTDPTAGLIIVKRPDGSYAGYGTSFGWSDQGNWDASANSPSLADGTGTAGYYYTVTASGSVDFGTGEIHFAVNDRVFYNGRAWRRWHSPQTTTLTKDSTGVYYVDQWTAALSGKWYRRSESVGTRAGKEGFFEINESEF
jgi:hypothetical protein